MLKNSLLALISVLLFLALTEASLHLLGLLLLRPQEAKNQIQSDGEANFRILALGESTTADYFTSEEGGAWPRRLEKKLNKLGIKARVFNAAIGGTSSPLLVARAPDLIEKFHPNLVITMMGINDNPYLIAQEQQRAFAWIQKTHLMKIFHLTIGGSYRKRCELSKNGISHEIASLQKKFISEHPHPNGELALNWITHEIPSDEQRALFLTGLADFFFTKKNFLLANELSAKAFYLFPRNENVAYWKLALSSPPNHPDDGTCAIDAAKVLECPDNIFDGLFSRILNCPSLNNSPQLEKLLTERGLSMAHTARLDLTRVHYQNLFRLLSHKGISLMAMQYPTMDIEGLQQYFSLPNGQLDPTYSKVILVENKKNFFRAVERLGYSAIFTDKFATTWGHTSEIGHEILAESALSAMEKNCQQLKLFVLCRK